MIEQIQDLIKALTTATISRELKWIYIPSEDLTEDSSPTPNQENSMYETIFLDRSIKIYREQGIIFLTLENDSIRLNIAHKTFYAVLKESLEILYFEIYVSLYDKDKVDEMVHLIEDTTLSLLC